MAHLLATIITIIAIIFVLIVIFALTTSFIVALFGGGPFVPTPRKAVKKVLATAKIKPGQKLYDIGAGDGRFLHFAEKLYGAKSVGFEIDPFVYMLARLNQIFFGWKGKIYRSDFQSHSLEDADIVICYMLPKTLKEYRKKFTRELKPGCKVISYTFRIHGWKPYKEIPPQKGIKRIYIYKVTKPATNPRKLQSKRKPHQVARNKQTRTTQKPKPKNQKA